MTRAALAVLVATLASCGPPRPVATAPAVVAPPEAVAALAPPSVDVDAPPVLRLPRTFAPTRYAARLAIDPAQPTFRGTIAITGEVRERAAVIWLHGRQLEIARAVARRDGAADVAIAVTPREPELLELRPAQPLAPGAWTLELDYTGVLDQLNTSGAFAQRVGADAYVFTQLEAVYARRVFPCVDEPDSKVPWTLTLDVPTALVAAANTPIAREHALDATTRRVEFAPTRPLPSYLVAFAVGPFEIVDAGKTRRGTPIRILALAGRRADAAWAAKTSARIVELAEDWFGTPYPYEKLDQVAIPLTVGFGAMENAGLITYTETLMLLDPKRGSRERQHAWVRVAAHEIAHQWFGNLVTPAFWDDIWLNEGFASWLTSKLSHQFDPTWRDDLQPLDTRDRALASDALVSARQIRQPIAVPDDILNAFDRITYDKGASVLHMFEAFVGPERFQRGVRAYLAARAWGNATSADFVAAIASTDPSAPAPGIAAAFATFLEQPGAPELTVTTACTGASAEVRVTQRRYVPPGAAAPAAASTPWIVPVCVAYDRGGGARGEACALLAAETGAIALPGATCPRWVMPNVDGRGYYRTAYTLAQLTALRDEAWPTLSWTERRAVFADAADAATTGRLPLAVALSFVRPMLAGNDRFTVGAALALPGGLETLVPDELRPAYEHYLRATFGPGAARVGLVPKPADGLDVERLRGGLLHTVGWLAREPAVVAEAVRLAARWRELPQAIRGLVLMIAVDARPALFARILRDVVTEPDRARRREMYAALAGVRDPTRLATAFPLVLDPKLDIRETHGLLWGGATEATRAAARAFWRANSASILARAPQAETRNSIAGASALFTQTCAAEERDAIADYVTRTFAGLPGGARTVRQNLEAMDQCIARKAALGPEVRAWLQGIRVPRR